MKTEGEKIDLLVAIFACIIKYSTLCLKVNTIAKIL